MANIVNLSELKKIINFAEEELEKLKEDDRRWFKQKRITRALKRAYAFLNTKGYTQEEVDKMYRVVWRSLQDIPIIWLWLFGLLLAGATMFASYETYSFFRDNWDRVFTIEPEPIPDLENVVYVKYTESNIVSLYNLIPVDDIEGLKNTAQTFNIRNDEGDMPSGLDYVVNYNVNIIEMNSRINRVIDKQYLRFQLTHYDSKTGERIVEPIRKFSDLEQNPDGTYKMYTGSQEKGAQTNFEVRIWVGPDADNTQQNRAYQFAFNVTAVVRAI